MENRETDDQELTFEHHRVVADAGQALLRVDKFLFDRLPNLSRTKIAEGAKAGHVLANGVPVKPNYRVKPLDVISVVFGEPPHEFQLIPEPIPLDIVYEDEVLLVINKPAGLVVHPGHGNYKGTLVNGLLYHFRQLPKNERSANAYPGLVHRIDKDTSGLLLAAKEQKTLNMLAVQFAEHTIDRSYLALAWGDVQPDHGTITGHIGRHPADRMQMTVFTDGTTGKHAITHYECLERFGYVTLLRCRLETGRTHQIRAHMRHIGHPLFADARYGGDKLVKGTTFAKYRQFVENCFAMLPRQALHAERLGFTHPISGERLRFECPMPIDMQMVIERWRRYVGGSAI